MSWLEEHITLQNYDDKSAEKLNAHTHFFGAFLSLVGMLFILFNLASFGTAKLKVGMIIFGLSNILLYSASGMYHYLPKNNLKRICRILDHSNIYFLIAGTYTPILLYIATPLATKLVILLYIICVLGIGFTLFFWGKLKPLHVVFYLIMGWIIVFFWNSIVPMMPKRLLFYVIGGGITYSIGVIFYAIKKIPNYHAIWHIFVLGGSIWFYIGFLKYFMNS